MKRAAIEKAESRLRLIRKSINELEGCKDFTGFRDTWSQFLTAAKGVYTVLEQGAKVSQRSLKWFSVKTADRKADELLSYVFHARNDDEHGLGEIARDDPGSFIIGKRSEGYSDAIRIDGEIGPGKTLNIQALDGKPVLIERRPRRPILLPVKDRSVIYPVATAHLGERVQGDHPLTVALCMESYLVDLVEEAKGLDLAE